MRTQKKKVLINQKTKKERERKKAHTKFQKTTKYILIRKENRMMMESFGDTEGKLSIIIQSKT